MLDRWSDDICSRFRRAIALPPSLSLLLHSAADAPEQGTSSLPPPASLQALAGAGDGSTSPHGAGAMELDSRCFPPRRAEPASRCGCSPLLLLDSADGESRGGGSPIDNSARLSAAHEARSSREADRFLRNWVGWLDPSCPARRSATGHLAPPREVFLLSLSFLSPSSFPLSSFQADRARLA